MDYMVLEQNDTGTGGGEVALLLQKLEACGEVATFVLVVNSGWLWWSTFTHKLSCNKLSLPSLLGIVTDIRD